MTTAREIVTDALHKINVLGTGQSLSNEDAQRAFRTLNQMLSTWSIDGNMVFVDTKETFPLDGSESYTIGPGATFDTERPTDIVMAFTTQGNTDYPLQKYGVREYGSITQKNTGSIPEIYYYDGNFPIATIFLYPVPSSQSSITLYSRKILTQFSTLDTDSTFPPEYETALVYNLAVWISSEYERSPSPEVQRVANMTYKAVERQNKRKDHNVGRIDVPKSESYSGDYNIFRGY